MNSVSLISLRCFWASSMSGKCIFSQAQESRLPSSRKLLKIRRTSSSVFLYSPEHLCRLPWPGSLSYSGYFVSSGNAFCGDLHFAGSSVPSPLWNSIFQSGPWNEIENFPFTELCRNEHLPLRLRCFPGRRPNRQSWTLTVIGILFLIKYALKSQSICGGNEIYVSATFRGFSVVFTWLSPRSYFFLYLHPPPPRCCFFSFYYSFLSPLLVSVLSALSNFQFCFVLFLFLSGVLSRSRLFFPSSLCFPFCCFSLMLIVTSVFFVSLCISLFQYLQFYIILTAGFTSVFYSLVYSYSAWMLKTVFMKEAAG